MKLKTKQKYKYADFSCTEFENSKKRIIQQQTVQKFIAKKLKKRREKFKFL